MSPTDLITAGAVLAGAVWLLVRSVRRSGGCAGCPGHGCGSRAGGAPAPLVKLGRPGRRGAGSG